MGMVVRSNIMAVNANRQLGMNNTQVGKSLEKLASGYRINRAGDDASGLAISEKMKAQIRGLETASANSQDGISLVQTAEGALTEVHDMLNRMVELAGKSANGTMDDSVDRDALQKEMTALKDEINRIAKGTNFNGTLLLDGSLNAGAASGSGLLGATQISFSAGKDANAVEMKTDATAAGTEGIVVNYTAASGMEIVFGTNTTSNTYTTSQINEAVRAAASAAYAADNTDLVAKSFMDFNVKIPGGSLTFAANDAATAMAATTLTTTGTASTGLTLQVGDTADDYNKLTVSIGDMSTDGLGIKDISVADQDSASAALELLKNSTGGGAINEVSRTRADLGALQNRLEHTINNLDVAAENMSSANSRIRDTDMAKEMMEYTKMNVLTQAAQAMLAQANTQPQSILQLLQ